MSDARRVPIMRLPDIKPVDLGVTYFETDTMLIRVEDSPLESQYTFVEGAYRFSPSDCGKIVTIFANAVGRVFFGTVTITA